MPDIGTYIEELKKQTLYEQRNESHLSNDILQEWETNRRVNEGMARLTVAINNVLVTFKGPYAEKFGGFCEPIITMYRGLDGWSVVKAIEAEGMTATKEIEEKKKGFLGKIGL